LSKPQMMLMYGQQWLKLLAPTAYGGLQWPLPDVLRLEEAISCADGSMGWVLTLCAGAGWFGGFVEEGLAENIFADPHLCMAGSGSVSGTAEITDTGYRISGKWLHASGAPDATIFTANCAVVQNGVALKNDKGEPMVLSFIFLRDEVTILPTWNSMGMMATASNAFQISDLSVSKERAFKIDSSAVKVDAPLYHYPFLQLAEATLAVNMSGMAVHFLDLCKVTFGKKKDNIGAERADEMYTELHHAQQELNIAREDMYEAVTASWQKCEEKKLTEETLNQVSITTYALAQTARNCIDALYPYCGLYAADRNTETNRVWRDMHTASQHMLLAFKPLCY
jgi:indole-3-acetate monooxygenase